MKRKSSPYYKTLADLSGEWKFETLETIETGNKKIRELLEKHKVISKYVEVIKPLVDAIRPIRELLMPMVETQLAITDYVDLHKRLSQNIHKLTAEGWYFSMEFIDTLELTDLYSLFEKDPESFESHVAQTFNEQISDIEKKLTVAFPKREELIKNIFSMHVAGNYEAAILLALTQADGMSKDIFFVLDKKGKKIPVGFFDMDRTPTPSSVKAQKLSKSFSVPDSSIFNVLLNQLAKVDRNSSLVLEGNTKRLSDLNRHAILHGESTDYGTRINSIKAILLLDFIDDLRVMDDVVSERWKKSSRV